MTFKITAQEKRMILKRRKAQSSTNTFWNKVKKTADKLGLIFMEEQTGVKGVIIGYFDIPGPIKTHVRTTAKLISTLYKGVKPKWFEEGAYENPTALIHDSKNNISLSFVLWQESDLMVVVEKGYFNPNVMTEEAENYVVTV